MLACTTFFLCDLWYLSEDSTLQCTEEGEHYTSIRTCTKGKSGDSTCKFSRYYTLQYSHEMVELNTFSRKSGNYKLNSLERGETMQFNSHEGGDYTLQFSRNFKFSERVGTINLILTESGNYAFLTKEWVLYSISIFTKEGETIHFNCHHERRCGYTLQFSRKRVGLTLQFSQERIGLYTSILSGM